MDDGPGVAPALRAQLFEPFFTTAAGGTGLGLYIAREVCEANNAKLDYVDAPQGACFTVSAGPIMKRRRSWWWTTKRISGSCSSSRFHDGTARQRRLDRTEAKALSGEQYELCLTDMRLADGDGLAVRTIVRSAAEYAGGGDYRLRQRRECGGGAQGGRLRLRVKPVGLDQLRALVQSALNTRPGAPSTEGDRRWQLLGAIGKRRSSRPRGR